VKKLLLSAVAVAAIVAPSIANAATVLYRNDFNVGTDYMAQAISALGLTTTTTSGSVSSFTLSNYDVVVYANQNSGVPGGDEALLSAYISSGGRVIFANWLSTAPTLESASTGALNLTSLTVGPLFSAGIVNPLSVVNPGWGTFSRGLSATGAGVVAGSFGTDAAIIVGNSGRTIHNGFLTDTVASSKLYENQLNFVLGNTGVPEPAAWAMMLAGFGLVGSAMRRREKVAVTFA
jgi:hypothetical protein